MQTLAVIGKRWFNRLKGQTYYSANILVDGKLVKRIDYAYGYGIQYEWDSRRWLAENGYLPGIEEFEGLSVYCRYKGIQYTNIVNDVKTKKEL